MKRSPSEQIYSVLQALQCGPCKLTHLMYKVNINYLILKGMLVMLQSQGYVEIEMRRQGIRGQPTSRYSKNFVLTAKGVAFFCSINQALKALNNLVEASDKQRYIQQAESLKASQT